MFPEQMIEALDSRVPRCQICGDYPRISHRADRARRMDILVMECHGKGYQQSMDLMRYSGNEKFMYSILVKQMNSMWELLCGAGKPSKPKWPWREFEDERSLKEEYERLSEEFERLSNPKIVVKKWYDEYGEPTKELVQKRKMEGWYSNSFAEAFQLAIPACQAELKECPICKGTPKLSMNVDRVPYGEMGYSYELVCHGRRVAYRFNPLEVNMSQTTNEALTRIVDSVLGSAYSLRAMLPNNLSGGSPEQGKRPATNKERIIFNHTRKIEL